MKLLIVDDHAVVRQGVAAMLLAAGRVTDILQAESTEAGLALAAKHPDLAAVMLDLSMPGMAGAAAVTAFGRARPDVPLIVFSASEDPADVHCAVDAGAMGYVPKSATPKVILLALDMVLAGEIYLPPLLLAQAPRRATLHMGAKGIAALTPRQMEILAMLSRGLPNKGIANALDLSDKTVKAHVTAIFRALDVVNRTQAANAARAAGLVEETK
jgi:DNA-binding NarL/FixJ family response regulator